MANRVGMGERRGSFGTEQEKYGTNQGGLLPNLHVPHNIATTILYNTYWHNAYVDMDLYTMLDI